jgi:hypothetical protein
MRQVEEGHTVQRDDDHAGKNAVALSLPARVHPLDDVPTIRETDLDAGIHPAEEQGGQSEAERERCDEGCDRVPRALGHRPGR